jgi:DNA-directed RNA polymerase subunit E'/Rpb7
MFFLVYIEKVVRIEPFELGKNLEYKIRRKYYTYSIHKHFRIENTTVGTCSGTYGYIIQVPV